MCCTCLWSSAKLLFIQCNFGFELFDFAGPLFQLTADPAGLIGTRIQIFFSLLPVYGARLFVGALVIASSNRFIRSLHTSDKDQ
jgi:hypothetical protein